MRMRIPSPARFEVSVNFITNILRVALFVVPIVSGLFTYRLCKELAARGPSAGEPGHRPGAS